MENRNNEFVPDYAIPPGDTLAEVLEDRGMTQAELAKLMGRPRKTINEIIKGKAAITPETALQLERVLDIPASFWCSLEMNYRLDLARIASAQKQEKESTSSLLPKLSIPNVFIPATA